LIQSPGFCPCFLCLLFALKLGSLYVSFCWFWILRLVFPPPSAVFSTCLVLPCFLVVKAKAQMIKRSVPSPKLVLLPPGLPPSLVPPLFHFTGLGPFVGEGACHTWSCCFIAPLLIFSLFSFLSPRTCRGRCCLALRAKYFLSAVCAFRCRSQNLVFSPPPFPP